MTLLDLLMGEDLREIEEQAQELDIPVRDRLFGSLAMFYGNLAYRLGAAGLGVEALRLVADGSFKEAAMCAGLGTIAQAIAARTESNQVFFHAEVARNYPDFNGDVDALIYEQARRELLGEPPLPRRERTPLIQVTLNIGQPSEAPPVPVRRNVLPSKDDDILELHETIYAVLRHASGSVPYDPARKRRRRRDLASRFEGAERLYLSHESLDAYLIPARYRV